MSSEGERAARVAVDLDRFFTLSIDMLCISGFDGYFRHVNPAWETTLGWTVEELTSRPWSDFVHPDDLESTIAEADRQTKLGFEAISFENRYLAKDGTYHWLRWNSRPCPEYEEMHAIAQDITDRKAAELALHELNASLEQQVAERTTAAEARAEQAERAEQQLRASEEQNRIGAERMRYFLKHMPLGIALVGAEMRYLFVSERFKQDFGVTEEEVFRVRHTDVFPGTEDVWRRAYNQCVAGELTQTEETAVPVRDGKREWLRWRAEPWIGSTGGTQGMVLYTEVITARREAEEQVRLTSSELARSNSELEAFTYSVSHDLKEPLRTIEAFSQFLLEDYADRLDDQGRDYLNKLALASARMKHLIEDLLALSRIGRRDEATTTEVSRVVADVLEGMRTTISERDADVQVEGTLPTVHGDGVRLEQIFGNLISNGIKFNRSDRPVVRIGLDDAEGAEPAFFVRDNGIGIEPEYHERIFGIFQRLHRREEFDGTGAGLAIVKRAVETLGGRIWVDSDGRNGTTVWFTLPLVREIRHEEESAAA